eukprot:gene8172-9606_t
MSSYPPPDIVGGSAHKHLPRTDKSKCQSKSKCQEEFDIEDDPMLSFGLRRRNRVLLYLFDWIFCIIAALVGGMLFYFVPVRGRLFRLDDPNISYPLEKELVPFYLLMIACMVLPVIIMLGTTLLHRRNWHDFHHATLGLLQSIALTLLLVALIKCFIGGLRPNFLVRCAPTPESIAAGRARGHNGVYYSKEICTGKRAEVDDAMAAYPSGHAGLAATGLVYLALFLNGKLKTFNNRGHMPIYVLVLACVFGAVLIGTSRIVDYRHTFGNVLLGWTIGVICALSMYRLNYLSVFGKNNGVPVCDFWFWHWKRHQDDHPETVEKNEQDLTASLQNARRAYMP